MKESFFLRKGRKKRWFLTYSCVKPNLDRQNTQYYHTTIWKSNLGSQASFGSIYVFDSPCARVFFVRKHGKKLVISEILMREAKSLQAKGMIIPHHYIQINPWLWHINWPYLNFSFTMWKGFCSWEKAEKMGNLGNFHVQSQILTGKTCDTTTQLCEKQMLAHRRHQLALSVFLIHHVQRFFFLRKHGKNR